MKEIPVGLEFSSLHFWEQPFLLSYSGSIWLEVLHQGDRGLGRIVNNGQHRVGKTSPQLDFEWGYNTLIPLPPSRCTTFLMCTPLKKVIVS